MGDFLTVKMDSFPALPCTYITSRQRGGELRENSRELTEEGVGSGDVNAGNNARDAENDTGKQKG